MTRPSKPSLLRRPTSRANPSPEPALAACLARGPGDPKDWKGNLLPRGGWIADEEFAAPLDAVATPEYAEALRRDFAEERFLLDPVSFAQAVDDITDPEAARQVDMVPSVYRAQEDVLAFTDREQSFAVETAGAPVRQLWRVVGGWDRVTLPGGIEASWHTPIAVWRGERLLGLLFGPGAIEEFALSEEADRDLDEDFDDSEFLDSEPPEDFDGPDEERDPSGDGVYRATEPSPPPVAPHPLRETPGAMVRAAGGRTSLPPEVVRRVWADWQRSEALQQIASEAHREAATRRLDAGALLRARLDEARFLLCAAASGYADPRNAAVRPGAPLSREDILARVPEGVFVVLAAGIPGAWEHLGTFRVLDGDLWLWTGSPVLDVGRVEGRDAPRYHALRPPAAWREYTRLAERSAPAPTVAVIDQNFPHCLGEGCVVDPPRASQPPNGRAPRPPVLARPVPPPALPPRVDPPPATPARPVVEGPVRLLDLRTQRRVDLDAAELVLHCPPDLDPREAAWLGRDASSAWALSFRVAGDPSWHQVKGEMAPAGQLVGHTVLLVCDDASPQGHLPLCAAKVLPPGA